MSNQVYNLRTKEKATEVKIEDLNKDIDDITTEIERLELRKTEGSQARIDDIKTEIEKLKLKKTEGLQVKINDIKAKMSMLALEKAIISNVIVVQPPEASSKPIKPRKKVMVLVSCFAGFFFLMILAFFIEYIRNAAKSGDR